MAKERDDWQDKDGHEEHQEHVHDHAGGKPAHHSVIEGMHAEHEKAKRGGEPKGD